MVGQTVPSDDPLQNPKERGLLDGKTCAKSNRHVSRGLVQDVTPRLLSKGWGYGAAPVSVGKVQTMRDNRIFCKH